MNTESVGHEVDYSIKHDKDKIKPTLVPNELVKSVAKIREYEEEELNRKVPILLRKSDKKDKGFFECPYCGKEFEAYIYNVTSHKTRSCGCMRGKFLIESRGTHGESKTRLYTIYRHILERCNKPSCKEYKWYGARGIKCEFKSYEEFREYALNNGYSDNLSCERIDVNGNYAPGNVKFIPLELQAHNTRSNVRIEYKGITLCAAEWAQLLGIRQDTLTKRKRSGWSNEKCLETPVYGKEDQHIDISLVHTSLINAVREVRLFGIKKYGDEECWRRVEEQRYKDALYRHWLAYLENPDGVDEESGLPILWHIACNVDFLVEMQKERMKKHETD